VLLPFCFRPSALLESIAMASLRLSLHVLNSAIALLLFINGGISIQLFGSVDAVPSAIPANCATASSANITCSQFVPASFVSSQGYLDNSTLQSLCTTTCTNSLLSFQTDVYSTCGTGAYTFAGNTTQTVQQIVDPLVWAYNVSCLTNGQSFCLPQVTNTSVPISPCSECALLYGATMLDSSYGRVRFDPESFSSILSSCGVPASSYPYTNPPTATATATTSAAAPNATCSGTLYTVQSGDSCNSIAAANSIATDRFLTANSLDYNCTSLTVGNQVCLGPSCALYQVQPNDTCDSILESETFYLTQLLSWNPWGKRNFPYLSSQC
jgi:hypothetical protein